MGDLMRIGMESTLVVNAEDTVTDQVAVRGTVFIPINL